MDRPEELDDMSKLSELARQRSYLISQVMVFEGRVKTASASLRSQESELEACRTKLAEIETRLRAVAAKI